MAIAITSDSIPATGWVMKNSVSMYINANSLDPNPPGSIDTKPTTIEPEIANVQNDNSVTIDGFFIPKPKPVIVNHKLTPSMIQTGMLSPQPTASVRNRNPSSSIRHFFAAK